MTADRPQPGLFDTFVLTPAMADPDTPVDPAPVDPQPVQPDETPTPTPLERPAPDLPEAPEAPAELPDLPAGPDHTPAHPDTPVELPEPPVPYHPEAPAEVPPQADPVPEDLPQEIPTNPAPDLSRIALRPGRPLDAGKLGDIITQAVLAATWKPRLHSAVEDIAHAGRMIDLGWITVAELDDRAAGFLAREGDYIHCLYIADHAQGQGVGRALLDHAKEGRDTLDLWTYQQNRGAQRFYRREGFVPGAETEGEHNDEGLPDVQFRWMRPA